MTPLVAGTTEPIPPWEEHWLNFALLFSEPCWHAIRDLDLLPDFRLGCGVTLSYIGPRERFPWTEVGGQRPPSELCEDCLAWVERRNGR